MFYLYRFLDSDCRIIYIGKTKQSLRYRFSQHIHLPESCYAKVRCIEYLECQTESDMSIKEIFYINTYRSRGMAEYNVADVSELPQEIAIDEKSDNWRTYMGSLPGTFCNSTNYLEGYVEEPRKYITRYDGRRVRYQQNTVAGKEKFVHPIRLQELEKIIIHFAKKIKTAQNGLYAFYCFRHIVILALGVSTPIKGKDLVKLKIADIYDEDGEIKPYIHKSRGEDICLLYPKPVEWLLAEYYGYIKDVFNKEDDYWLFWGQRDDDNSITTSAYAKILTKVSTTLRIDTSISIESLRKTFFRYIFDASDNKYEAIACIDFFIQENYRHTPGRVLKYIGVLNNKEDFDPIAFIEDKYIMDALSEECINSIKEALQLLNQTWSL